MFTGDCRRRFAWMIPMAAGEQERDAAASGHPQPSFSVGAQTGFLQLWGCFRPRKPHEAEAVAIPGHEPASSVPSAPPHHPQTTHAPPPARTRTPGRLIRIRRASGASDGGQDVLRRLRRPQTCCMKSSVDQLPPDEGRLLHAPGRGIARPHFLAYLAATAAVGKPKKLILQVDAPRAQRFIQNMPQTTGASHRRTGTLAQPFYHAQVGAITTGRDTN